MISQIFPKTGRISGPEVGDGAKPDVPTTDRQSEKKNPFYEAVDVHGRCHLNIKLFSESRSVQRACNLLHKICINLLLKYDNFKIAQYTRYKSISMIVCEFLDIQAIQSNKMEKRSSIFCIYLRNRSEWSQCHMFLNITHSFAQGARWQKA